MDFILSVIIPKAWWEKENTAGRDADPGTISKEVFQQSTTAFNIHLTAYSIYGCSCKDINQLKHCWELENAGEREVDVGTISKEIWQIQNNLQYSPHRLVFKQNI